MKRVPKKNISRVLFDIKPPEDVRGLDSKKRETLSPKTRKSPAEVFKYKGSEGRPITLPRKRKSSYSALFFVFLAILIGVGAYVGILYSTKDDIYASLGAAFEYLRDSANSFKKLDITGARNSLESASKEIRDIRTAGESYGIWSASQALGKLWPFLSRFPNALNNIEALIESALSLTEATDELSKSGINYFISVEGDKLLSALKKMLSSLKTIRESSEELKAFASELETFAVVPVSAVAGNYLKLNTELLRIEEFLSAIISLLDSKEPRHILVFFQNPSEMRPGGGFIGSYADVAILGGALKYIDVRDIYDPDGQLELKVVPPKPLQAITTSWGARDANWFFDFPTSAKKIIRFLEASKMYSEQGTFFAGAIGINTDVIATVLRFTGPIELSSYHLTLNADNFLEEVQKEVEIGESKRVGEPKRILKDLTPIILSRLAALPDEKRQELIWAISKHLERGDIVFFSRDAAMQHFFLAHGLAGAIADLPQPFYGDYLAVVNANVAGGKSDIYVRQEVKARSYIDLRGYVKSDVVVLRTHTGGSARYSWYRAVNQDYLRLLVAPNVRLLSLVGNTPKTVRAPINYERNGYQTDPDVIELEENEREGGKKVISAWLTVESGAKRELRVSYENPVALPIREGGEFTVILEQQPGVRGKLRYELEAPPGFLWREVNNAVYTYEEENPPKRVIITLTLRKV